MCGARLMQPEAAGCTYRMNERTCAFAGCFVPVGGLVAGTDWYCHIQFAGAAICVRVVVAGFQSLTAVTCKCVM
jgi:hypothetical protein